MNMTLMQPTKSNYLFYYDVLCVDVCRMNLMRKWRQRACLLLTTRGRKELEVLQSRD